LAGFGVTTEGPEADTRKASTTFRIANQSLETVTRYVDSALSSIDTMTTRRHYFRLDRDLGEAVANVTSTWQGEALLPRYYRYPTEK
jgi:hypothetical protein